MTWHERASKRRFKFTELLVFVLFFRDGILDFYEILKRIDSTGLLSQYATTEIPYTPWRGGGGGGGALPIMVYTGRFRPKGVPFSGCRCIRG